MYEFAIRCPETGLPVATGEITAQRSVPRSIIRKTLSPCPACAGAHVWQLREAWVIAATETETATDAGDAELI